MSLGAAGEEGQVALNSFIFAAFLVPCLAAYWLAPIRWRWLVFLAASLAFYALSDPRHVGFLLAAASIVYAAALALDARQSRRQRRLILWLALLPVVGALCLYRATDAIALHPAAVAGPLGFSFFSLRLIGYLVDVYRGNRPAERHAGVFSGFVAAFPELASGPIERAGDLLPQLRSPDTLSYARVSTSTKRFAWGLFKKVVVADRLKLFVDAVYGNPAGFDGAGYALATVMFAFQVYCDFSGYTDMAVGTGGLFGLRFARNFDRPYLSRSIAEFWTRWHISLSSWLRDYLFLPLFYRLQPDLEARFPEGETAARVGYALSAIVTMTVCGAWHGARRTYVVWALLMAAFLVASVMTRKVRARMARRIYGRHHGVHAFVKVASTFLLVNVSWVFFRADSVASALAMIGAMPSGLVHFVLRAVPGVMSGEVPAAVALEAVTLGQGEFNMLLAAVSLAIVFWAESSRGAWSLSGFVGRCPVWIRWPAYAVFLLVVITFRAPAGSTFIYAGF
jgi:D-alanyl-lipoteichoic acid acyltransferase DltB (MBOAT superfamily)